MPKISVILPVYKVEPYIHRCVDSILSQTFADFELVIVDDGSPDNCPAICDEYATKDSRIHVIHQQNGGLSAARNTGIDWAFANSDSEWITFIDSDDWVDSNYLEYLYKTAYFTNTSISICNYIETDTYCLYERQELPSVKVVSPEHFYVDNRVNFIIACGKLYKKNLFSKIRYPVGMIHEDEFVTYKILFNEENLSIIESKLYYYFQNANGITKSVWTPKRLHVIDAFKEQLNFFVLNNHKKAETVTARLLINTLATGIQRLRESSIQKNVISPIINNLSKDLRKYLKKYKKLMPFNSNKYIYEIAFPKRMYLYWIYTQHFNK